MKTDGLRLLVVIAAAVLGFVAAVNGLPVKVRAAEPSVHAQASRPEAGVPVYEEGFVNHEREGVMCHVSTIAPLGAGGGMLVAWYAGSREGAGDVAIYSARCDGMACGQPEVLVDSVSAASELGRHVKKVGNPMLMADTRGRLWLFYASVFAGGWSGASVNVKVSRDHGQTWTRSEKLNLSPAFNITNNVKNSGMELGGGVLAVPAYHESAGKYSTALFVEQTGGGITYMTRRMTHAGRFIQPAFVDMNGTIVAIMRNMAGPPEPHAAMAESRDLGMTWGPARLSTLPNPNSGLDAAITDGGLLIAAINDSFTGRDNLTLMGSSDGGATWMALHVFDRREGAEYSYPSIARDAEGNFHMTYTYERKRIKHVIFNKARIRQWLAEADGA